MLQVRQGHLRTTIRQSERCEGRYRSERLTYHSTDWRPRELSHDRLQARHSPLRECTDTWIELHPRWRRCYIEDLQTVSIWKERYFKAYSQPPSLQFVMPLGVPLYPVLMTRLSRTMTHPTRRFMQLLRCAAREASCIKYWSQLGLSLESSVRFKPLRAM